MASGGGVFRLRTNKAAVPLRHWSLCGLQECRRQGCYFRVSHDVQDLLEHAFGVARGSSGWSDNPSADGFVTALHKQRCAHSSSEPVRMGHVERQQPSQQANELTEGERLLQEEVKESVNDAEPEPRHSLVSNLQQQADDFQRWVEELRQGMKLAAKQERAASTDLKELRGNRSAGTAAARRLLFRWSCPSQESNSSLAQLQGLAGAATDKQQECCVRLLFSFGRKLAHITLQELRQVCLREKHERQQKRVRQQRQQQKAVENAEQEAVKHQPAAQPWQHHTPRPEKLQDTAGYFALSRVRQLPQRHREAVEQVLLQKVQPRAVPTQVLCNAITTTEQLLMEKFKPVAVLKTAEWTVLALLPKLQQMAQEHLSPMPLSEKVKTVAGTCLSRILSGYAQLRFVQVLRINGVDARNQQQSPALRKLQAGYADARQTTRKPKQQSNNHHNHQQPQQQARSKKRKAAGSQHERKQKKSGE